MKKIISFIGTGKMATALIGAIYKNKLAKTLIASDRNEENLIKAKSQNRGIKTTKNNIEAIRNADIVFICVKPQDINIVLKEIKNEIKNQLVVSIAAGIKIMHIESILGRKRIIRVMPNINCLVGEMAAGFSAGKYATKKDIRDVGKLLNCAGMSFLIKEELMDILSSIGPGSGPAFFAYFIDSVAKAGIKHGLSKDVAYKLAAQTALGTGKLILDMHLAPEEIITMVASKKGMTLEGLKVLNKHKTNKIIEKSIEAAYKRSKELGK